MSTIAFEVVQPINDPLVESVAIAIWQANPYHAQLAWKQAGPDLREEKRTEARAAISVILQYLICLEATHGDH
jgi:hypothetical protein